MQEDSSTFKIPRATLAQAEVFVATSRNTPNSSDLDIYNELNAIAEELEKCRLENSLR